MSCCHTQRCANPCFTHTSSMQRLCGLPHMPAAVLQANNTGCTLHHKLSELHLRAHRRPVLVLSVPGLCTSSDSTADTGSRPSAISFRILPVISEAQFPPRKLLPGRNNVRSHVTAAGTIGADQTEPLPTPSYNAIILQVTQLIS